MNKKQIRTEVHNTVQLYCEDCMLYQHFCQIHSRAYAHNFCVNECSVGEKLQKYGEKLS